MKTQKEFVEEALAFNRENGFVSVNRDVAYEDAHYPKPKGTGEDTVPLTHGQHQIQGLLQSEEEGRCCFFPGDTKAFLFGEGFLCPDWFELCETYEKWVAEAGRRKAELSIGLHAPGVGAAAGRKAFVMGVGCHAPGNAAKGGRKAAETGVGAHRPGKAAEGGRKGGLKGGRTTSSQRLVCLVTGHVNNPGNLTKWQQKRDIPTHLRCRLDGSELVSQTMLLGLAAS